LLWLTGSQA
jgi:hypothetical protein